MVTKLNWLVENPIAHRGYHDKENSIYENSLSACKAAVENGFAIEVDLHPSSDGIPMVFHDHTLKRMCNDSRNTRDLTASELSEIKLGDSNDHIPTLRELLELVAGKSVLVLELKGHRETDDGFVTAVAETLKDYKGHVVLMSFDHWLIQDARKYAPHLPVGLVAEGGEKDHTVHQSIVDECQVDFVSYDQEQLPNSFCDQFKATGKPLICWTVRSAARMKELENISDQITFEQFDPNSA